jgi:hypothetical protein
MYKICEIRRATNFFSFTHSMTLFLAVVLDFVLLALIKIKSVAGITHNH